MLLLKSRGINAASKDVKRITRLTTNRVGLISELVFGRDIPTSISNSASENALDATIIGELGFSPNFVSGVGDGDYIDTKQYVSESMTIMLFFRQSSGNDTDVLFGSNHTTSRRFFVQISNTTLQGNYGSFSGTSIPNFFTTSREEFRALCFTIDGSSNPTVTLEEFKDGALVGTTATQNLTGNRVFEARPIVIGSLGRISNVGSADHAVALMWDRKLDAAERLAAYQEAYEELKVSGIDA